MLTVTVEGMRPMENTTKKIRLRNQGQITLPADFRKQLDLDADTILNATVVGESIILTPQNLLGPEVARRFSQGMQERGLTLEDLLESLETQRERYNRERVGGSD